MAVKRKFFLTEEQVEEIYDIVENMPMEEEYAYYDQLIKTYNFKFRPSTLYYKVNEIRKKNNTMRRVYYGENYYEPFCDEQLMQQFSDYNFRDKLQEIMSQPDVPTEAELKHQRRKEIAKKCHQKFKGRHWHTDENGKRVWTD